MNAIEDGKAAAQLHAESIKTMIDGKPQGERSLWWSGYIAAVSRMAMVDLAPELMPVLDARFASAKCSISSPSEVTLPPVSTECPKCGTPCTGCHPLPEDVTVS